MAPLLIKAATYIATEIVVKAATEYAEEKELEKKAKEFLKEKADEIAEYFNKETEETEIKQIEGDK